MKKYRRIFRSALMQNLVVLISSESQRPWRSLYTNCLCDMLLR